MRKTFSPISSARDYSSRASLCLDRCQPFSRIGPSKCFVSLQAGLFKNGDVEESATRG